MLAHRSRNRKLPDKVFNSAKKAEEAILKYGKENVVNATIGSLHDENGKLVVFKTVIQTYRNLPDEEIANYAADFIGDQEYRKNVLISLFGDDYETFLANHYISVIATPGGTGAISNTIRNYLNEKDKALIPEWLWTPYIFMVEEKGGIVEYYSLFDNNQNIDTKNLGAKISQLAQTQDNVIVVINDPCHNPTGCRLTLNEWKQLRKDIIDASEKANIILLVDIAYIDFDCRTEQQKKAIYEVLKNFPKEVLVVLAFSISKSLTSYGLRVGAQIALSTSKTVIEEFENANAFSCRATWSNISRGGMKVFSTLISNKDLRSELEKERNYYRDLVLKRAELFLKEAKECNLEVLPYKSGFFLTIPTYQYTATVEKLLEENNIFAVALSKGIRIALCSIPLIKIKGLAQKIKHIIEQSKNMQ